MKRKIEYRTNPDTGERECRYEGDRLWAKVKKIEVQDGE